MGEIFARPFPVTALPFTGERLTSEFGGQTEMEHLHRYMLARHLCRGRDVLDIASGEGYGAALLGQVASTVIGVEVAEDAGRTCHCELRACKPPLPAGRRTPNPAG